MAEAVGSFQGSQAFLIPVGTPVPVVPIETSRITAGAAIPEAQTSTSSASLGYVFAGVAAVSALTGTRYARRSTRNRQSRQLVAALPQDQGKDVSRSNVLRGLGGLSTGLFTSATAPLSAEARSLEEAVKDCTTFGVPELAPTEEAPSGWQWLVEPLGLAQDYAESKFQLGGEKQVIRFLCPPLWVVNRPSIDYNGAAGTVSVNDYGKGDSATFYADVKFKGKLEEMSKDNMVDELYKALTQKGKNMIEDIQIKQVTDGPAPGLKYLRFEYGIPTGAGFYVTRAGFAMMAQESRLGHLQIFWSATLNNRLEDLQEKLETLVKSFRIKLVPENVDIGLQGQFVGFDNGKDYSGAGYGIGTLATEATDTQRELALMKARGQL
eukprot:TRINITY_DN82190_c0_g1_i1.p1 TRINITY_DN82190_c0_g1~~TRINITY_DN82190_c0_g1_i1.p1  ORF type:complete len:380 (-),score=68.70 TRINITY_DN82190_c0_g1_i1:60-1199(-)